MLFARPIDNFHVVLCQFFSPSCELPLYVFKPHEPYEAMVVGAQKKTASKEVMSNVPAEFYYSQ